MSLPTSRAQLSSVKSPELPIYILLREAREADELAHDLRQHGFRARSFVDLGVLRNAVRTQPPGAVLLSLDLVATAEAGHALAAELQATAGAPVPLVYVHDEADFASRLKAVRAGGSAFFPTPVSRAGLVHHLHQHVNLPALSEPMQVLALGGKEELGEVLAGLEASGILANALETPAQLLAELAGGRYDALIIGEFSRPGEAAELAQLVRQTGTYQSLPIIVLTQLDKRSLDEAAAEAGVDALVGLPVDAKDLAAIVQARVLRARGLRAAYHYSARRDPATALFTADYFFEALRHASQEGSRGGALLYLALHSVPSRPALETRQRLLTYLAELLRQQLPALAVAAAVDTDAVAVLLPAADAAEVEALTQTLAQRLQTLDVRLGQQRVALGAQVGVTLLSGRHRSGAEALLQAREAASLQAGAEPAHHAQPARQPAADPWLGPLQEALRTNRFRLVYQPIASLSGQPTPYYEVFLRMLDGHGGDILPQEFLPSAQRTGNAPAVDRWVVGRAIHVLEEQKSLQHKPVLFVKVMAETLADPRFPRWLADRLAVSPVEPARLVLQLTQRAVVTQPAESVSLAQELHRLGCLLAVEHFGSGGDGSQELMKTLRPNFIKLAPQLTHDVGTNLEHQKQVQAISGFSRSIQARTVAALVQDAINLSVLWRCGVEYIQGYFMQEPVDVFSETESLR